MKTLFRQFRIQPITCPPCHRAYPRVYFDFSINQALLGRVVFQLYDNVSPKAVTNFLEVAQGTTYQGQNLHYKNTNIQKILPFRGIWGGILGGSIYGKSFPDENYALKHDREGLLTTSGSKINSNDSGFIITLGPAEWLDQKSVVFGEVISGMEYIRAIEKLGGANGVPKKNVTISDCNIVPEDQYHKYDQEPIFDVWAPHHH